jgi:hypothetical protein
LPDKPKPRFGGGQEDPLDGRPSACPRISLADLSEKRPTGGLGENVERALLELVEAEEELSLPRIASFQARMKKAERTAYAGGSAA